MAHTVAFCSDIPQLQQDLILNTDWCKKFPGSEWLPLFANQLAAKNAKLTTGDQALQSVLNGTLQAKSVIVIAAEDSFHAESLLKLGAKGGVVICAESPLFARTFYERIAEIGTSYSARILFQGTIDEYFPHTPNTYPTRFPSFSRNHLIRNSSQWLQKKPMTMVASSKFWRTPFNPTFLLQPKKLESWARGKLGLTQSAIKKLARKSQLHERRLEMIHYFGDRGKIDLFGKNWDDRHSIPYQWRRLIEPILKKIWRQSCSDKKETISNYKFAFAIENISYPGYHTEKIIDCFAAGVIPLYLGDPLIEKTIPSTAFINLDNFRSPAELDAFLENFSEADATKMLSAARSFLTGEGDAYSYEAFSENILKLIHPLW